MYNVTNLQKGWKASKEPNPKEHWLSTNLLQYTNVESRNGFLMEKNKNQVPSSSLPLLHVFDLVSHNQK